MGELSNVAVLGGGSFGTALANLVADNGHAVRFWLRDEARVSALRRDGENSRYLPGFPLSANITPTADRGEAVAGADVVFVAIPSSAFRSVVRDFNEHLHADQILVSTTKGIEKGTFAMMSEILAEETPCRALGVLSGPNLAKEIASKLPTGTVIASEFQSVRDSVRALLSSRHFRVYGNPDVYGVELGGALKNIYAVATGMAAALGTGENTKSMLITRSLAEMSRLAERIGGDAMTFLGLAGVGDLVVTCSSPLSRNYRIGYYLGEGYSLEEAVAKIGETAEGINTIELVKQKAEELGVYMPIVAGLYAIVVERRGVRDVADQLMLDGQNTDVEFVLRERAASGALE